MSGISPGTVLVAGDLNLDLVLTGDVRPRFGQVEQLLDGGELVLGGSAAIVAAGLARLGVPTRFVGRVGDDAFGRIAVERLAATGVDTSAVETDVALPTGLSVILSAADDRAILTVPGTIPTLRPETVARAARGADHVHIASYFLQPQLAAGLPGLLRDIRSSGATVSLDTNWDPAEQWAGLAEVLPHVDVLLPNLEELRAISRAMGAMPLGAASPGAANSAVSSGSASSSGSADESLARSITGFGPRVVVKAGADGGWSVGTDGAVAASTGLSVDVVDTTGAGDSFDAGYLAALAHGITDEGERLGWAAAAGSLSTLSAGGTGSQPSRAELIDALR